MNTFCCDVTKGGKGITTPKNNGIDGQSSEQSSNATSGGGGGGGGVGVWIGVSAGILLVLLFITALVYLKRGSWMGKKGQKSPPSSQESSHASNGTNKTSVSMMPPNMPLPPTPFTAPQPSQHLYATANEIYEQLPGENHQLYDLTYEDTQAARRRYAQPPERPRSPPPSPPAAVTVNGFVLA